jgi:glycosyltransferase involved in cell wall biosynthesis
MRIAIFTDTYLPDKNGVAMSIDNFTRLMAADGHQIMIFCPKKDRYKDSPLENISITRYSSITAPTNKDTKIALPFVWTVIHDLKDFDPDVVHIQTPMGIGLVGIWATKILKLKHIQTYHTYIPDFLVYFSPATLLGIDKITNYINNSKLAKSIMSRADVNDENPKFKRLKSRLSKISKEIDAEDETESNRKLKDSFGGNFTRLIYNRANLVLTPSDALRKVLKKQGVRVKIEVMSNGVDNSMFKKKTDYKITERMIHAGRLGHEKSTGVVIEAFYIAQKTNPNLRLDIYGDGPAKKTLQHLVKKLKISRKIKFWGAYDINKLSQKLCEYDFFVTASTIETQGIVLLEAMASGLPIVAVDKLAVPEIVHNGKNGYLSEAGNAEAMAKNMLKIVESSERLKQFSHESILVAKSHEITECKNRLLQKYIKISK